MQRHSQDLRRALAEKNTAVCDFIGVPARAVVNENGLSNTLGENASFDTNVYRPHSIPTWRRYAVASLCVLGAFLLRYLLAPILGPELPFMMSIAAALVAAWYGGILAGIAALAAGLLLADREFVASRPTDSVEVIRVLRYVFTSSLGIGLIEALHRARRRTEKVVQQLVIEVQRRKCSENELLKAEAKLLQNANDLESRVRGQTAKSAATVESLRNLLYLMVHTLRAPLRAMEGYASLLESDCAEALDTRARDYSRHISQSAKQMDRLIQALLAYGRLGHIEVELTVVNLGYVIQHALFQLAFQIQTACAEVQVLGPLPDVLASSNLLEEVLINLLENAIKFVNQGTQPRVQILAEPQGRKVRLWVKDNGLGIDPHFHQRIFAAFETLPCGGCYTGTGMGLALVKQGVQRMGGQVGVESQPGTGSRFWIELLSPKAQPP